MQKKLAEAELRQSKFAYEALVSRRDTLRAGKLRAFLDQHKHASQWATCIAALEDALKHGVKPTDSMVCDAISRCGQRGKLDTARRLYTDFYKRLGRARPLAAHVAFMGACADCGDFVEAHNQFTALKERDEAIFAKNATHAPVVTADLTTEYLRAALSASVRAAKALPLSSSPSSSSSYAAPDAATGQEKYGGDGGAAAATGSSSRTDGQPHAHQQPWATALSNLVSLRRDVACFRPHNTLTPLLLEQASQLADFGGQWKVSLALLAGAAREQAVIPPEAYDAAIRCCFRARRHPEVVDLMCKAIATRTPPDECSVRLALQSSEEVAALERSAYGTGGSSSSSSLVSSSGTSTAATAAALTQRAWALSLTLFDALRHNGVPLYQQSYESPLRACALAGRWEEALRILHLMRKDGRPVSTEMYRVALAARLESCPSVEQAQRIMESPVAQRSVVLYLAAMQCAMRCGDWRYFARLDREMKNHDMPETYDKMRLLIEAAFLQGKYHSVLMRYARFENVTKYERDRVLKDEAVRLHEEDFTISDALLDMVMEAYARLEDKKDPMVEVAYRAAVKRRERGGAAQLPESFTGHSTAPEWMFSQRVREVRTPSQHY